ncbi:MAG: 3-dehydroquinate synthase [Phycisphaerae bacterium]|nr:3-dehydroquinate synthase [Phycisphaerae bacterium]
MTAIPVRCPGGEYEVVVEPGILGSVGERCVGLLSGRRILMVVDSAVADTHAVQVEDSLVAGGFRVERCTVEADERRKTIETIQDIYQAALKAGLDRHDAILGIGGGLTGDMAGFAAASYLRGIDLVTIPTTLLSMVDASVGGKTGVNLPLPGGDARLGKNLAGAFWQPRLVLADPLVLGTLDDRQRRCGLAECVKHGLIDGPQLLDLIDAGLDAILDADPEAVASLVEHAVRIKVGVVQDDEREQGRRAVLNLGHTFAHAIEPIKPLDLLHGEAVSIGLVAAIGISGELGLLEGDWAADFIGRLERIGLPIRLPRTIATTELIDRMGFDKKIRAGHHTLVVPIRPGHVEIVQDVPEAAIAGAWSSVGAD